MKTLVFCAALLWAGSASAIQRYTATVLPTGFYGVDRNAAGTIVGYFSTDVRTAGTAAMYDGNSVTLLPGANIIRGINDDGTMIAGEVISLGRGFFRTAGASNWTELTYPGFANLNVFDINNAGTIGGGARNPGSGFSAERGFEFSNGVLTPLPIDMLSGSVSSLNEIGDAIGTLGSGAGSWTRINGTYTRYFNFNNQSNFQPARINDRQQVVGTFENSAGIRVAGVLENGQLRAINSRKSQGFLINNRGEMLGIDTFGAFIYDPYAGKSFVLNQWIDSMTVQGISNIFDDGSILAWNRVNAPGGVQSVLLTPYGRNANPVPEPASWAMLIAGFGLVGAVQRRRLSYNPAAARPDRA